MDWGKRDGAACIKDAALSLTEMNGPKVAKFLVG